MRWRQPSTSLPARRLIRKSGFDLVLADVRLPKGDGLSLLEWLNGGHRHVPFVVMTGYANYPDAVRAVKSGADDYLPKPVDPERLLDTVRELLRPSLSLPQGGKTLFRLGSPAAREVERMATLVAPVEVSVLILGANGTGKESVARRIHEESDRRLMPFCGGELQRHLERTCPVAAVRARQRLVHGCGEGHGRVFRHGRRRHAVPRRDRHVGV